jgi:hypothetical protein
MPTIGTSAWAKRFALRRQKTDHAVPDREEDAESLATAAIELLWTMFDEAVREAQAALNEYGSAERIQTDRTSHDYRLSMPGPDGRPRQIAAFANVRMVDGQLSGGSQIATSQTRATIYVAPGLRGGHLHWIVEATDKMFTPHVVGDLFLSVFSDDPAATRRLSACFTLS